MKEMKDCEEYKGGKQGMKRGKSIEIEGVSKNV